MDKRMPLAVLAVLATSLLLPGCSKKPAYEPGCYMGPAIQTADRQRIEQAAARFYDLLRSRTYRMAYDESSTQLKVRLPFEQMESVWTSISETLTIPAALTLDDLVLVVVQEGARGPQSVSCVTAGDSLSGRTMSATDQPFQAYLVHSGTVGGNTYTYASVWFLEEDAWRMATFGAKPKLQGGHDWTWYLNLAIGQRDKGNNRNAALLLNMAMDLVIPAPWIRPDEVKRMEAIQRKLTVYEVPMGRPLSWISADSTEFKPYLVTPEAVENGLALRFAYEVPVPPDTALVIANAPKLADFIRVTFPEYGEVFHHLTLEAYTEQVHHPVWRSEFSLREGP